MNRITNAPPTTNEVMPLSDRVAPQRRPDGAFFDDLHRRRQRAGAQNDRQIARFLDVEAAGDRGPAAADAFLDHRRRVDIVVEHDRHAALHVGRSDLFE